MTWLSLLICIKIVISVFLIIIPYLFFPAKRLDKIMGANGNSPLIYRLYGMGVLALLVGYASGILQAESGEMPWGIIAMGIVSNLGASVLLLFGGGLSRAIIPAGIFGSIGVGLVLAAFLPSIAISPIW